MPMVKLILSFLVIFGYYADGFAMRCRQSLVYEGDSKYIVQKKCGEPLSKEIHEEPEVIVNQYGQQYGAATNTYEIWTYQQSSSDFLYEVLFQDGVVKSITANRT